MYKILLLRSTRGVNGVNSLYHFLTEIVVHEDGTSEEVISEFEDEVTLETKILELLQTRSRNDIYVVSDKTYTIDILFSPTIDDGENEEPVT
ncbi:hypothetical protein [Kineothrix sedimenti]|uniref:Uncharacterized protein n=1 Tax=Kineothrix sedimenti TaxID=3123317 RepID=A0ABZ3F2I0_9FIRM